MFVTLDESGIQKGSPWMAFGALWLPDDELVPEFEAEATRIRQRHRCWAEFKWAGLDGRYGDAYSDYMDALFALSGLTFTVMVKDTSEINEAKIRQYNGAGGRSLAYLKVMRRLIQYRIGPVGVANDHRRYTLLYDDVSGRGTIKADFERFLRTDLQAAAIEHNKTNCEFVQITKANSKIVHLLQAFDLLTGATCDAWIGVESGNERKRDARRGAIARVEQWRGRSLTVQHRRGPMDVWRHRWSED